MTRRVAVTGIGVIAAPGSTRAAFWESLREGRSAIRPMTLVPEGSLRFPNAAEVAGYIASAYMDEKEADLLDRFAQFALIAAREAVAASGLASRRNSAPAAIVTGTSPAAGPVRTVSSMPLRQEHIANSSVDYSADHGQLRRQPHRARIGNHRTILYGLDGVRVGNPRHRPGVLDGAQRASGCSRSWWIGNAILDGISKSLGSHAHRRA
jgi:hypothetical protein